MSLRLKNPLKIINNLKHEYMNLTVKALLYQLGSFAFFFLIVRFLVFRYSTLEGIWIPISAFVVATILSPKFKNIKTPQGEKIFVKWFFFKTVREL
mgnify:CR=1 FL=1